MMNNTAQDLIKFPRRGEWSQLEKWGVIPEYSIDYAWCMARVPAGWTLQKRQLKNAQKRTLAQVIKENGEFKVQCCGPVEQTMAYYCLRGVEETLSVTLADLDALSEKVESQSGLSLVKYAVKAMGYYHEHYRPRVLVWKVHQDCKTYQKYDFVVQSKICDLVLYYMLTNGDVGTYDEVMLRHNTQQKKGIKLSPDAREKLKSLVYEAYKGA